MPDYSLLKILHVIAVALTVIGLLLSAFTVANPPPVARLSGLRRWDRFVTGPALVAVWILGVLLAIEGHWFATGWLSAKLVFVLVLSALHGMQTGALRKLAQGRAAPTFLRFSPYIVLVSVAAILVLVETKPF